MLQELEENSMDKEVNEMIDKADVDENGEINKEEC